MATSFEPCERERLAIKAEEENERSLVYLSIEQATEVMESIECCVEDINEEKAKDPEYIDNNEELVSAYYSIKTQLTQYPESWQAAADDYELSEDVI